MKEILIYGPIGGQGTSAEDVVRQFQEAKEEDVLVRIHSEGGSVLDGEAILNAIRQHDATVFGQIDGMAFSMGAIIALELKGLGGLTMPADGWIMLHEVRAGTGGTQQDLERTLTQVKAMNASIAVKVSDALSISEEEAAEKLREEIWMNGQEALAAGLVSSLTPATALAAQVDADQYQNAPKHFFDQIENKKPRQQAMKLFKLFQNEQSEKPSLELAEIGPDDLGAEVASLQKDLDETKASNIAALVVRDETHAQNLASALSEQKSEIEANHQKEIAIKDAAILEAEVSSEQKANATLAQAGHDPVEILPEEITIKEQYLAMKPGDDRQKFRQTHKDELKEAFGPGVLR